MNYRDSLDKQITQMLYDCLLKYGCWTSSVGITWELVRNEESQAPPTLSLPNQSLPFTNIPRRFLCN